MISVQQCHDVLSRDSPVGRRHHSGASSWFSTLVWHQLRNPEKGRGLAAGKNRSRLYFRGLWGKRGPKGLKWLPLRRWPRTPPFIFRVNVAAVDAAGGNRKWKIPVGLWLVCPTWDWWVGRVKLKTVPTASPGVGLEGLDHPVMPLRGMMGQMWRILASFGKVTGTNDPIFGIFQ